MDEQIEALRRELGCESSDLSALGEAEIELLLEAIRSAKRRRAQALEVALDRASSSLVPAFLRGPLRRILSS